MLPATSAAGFKAQSCKSLRLRQYFSCKQFQNLTPSVPQDESLFTCGSGQSSPEDRETSNGFDLDCDSLDDESIDALYSSSDDEKDNEESDAIEFQKADDESYCVPFWFSFEEHSHTERIVKAYTKKLHLHQQRHLACRLPNFVGRIERQPVYSCENEFKTLDVVQIYRRDIRQVGSTVSLMEEKVLLTTWDDQDGVPARFEELGEPEDIEYWQEKRIFNISSSFVYCMPVWRSSVEFCYEVTPEQKQVGYANEPFNFTKYIPSHYLPQTSSDFD